jgi:two-component system chemotaxis response regulator CheB
MHVLVVDDSAVVRQTVSALLAGEPGVTVSVAADPIIAMQKMAVQRPDVILLDLQMPRMDGLTFLDKIMAEDPIPVVICSAVTEPQSEPAFHALARGAIDVVAKPKVGIRDFLQESRVIVIDALRAAAQARLPRRRHAPAARLQPAGRAAHAAAGVIAVGASTGGTEALRIVMAQLPASTPGVLIVQHMPEVFTTHFARHLDQESAMDVAEAREGDRLERGRALLAPGNRHMMLRRDGRGYFVALGEGPLISRHRPSVDVLFRSVAEVAGARAVGVLLTGMGADGADGLLEMKRRGAATIAQDESSCVVFGMPREAILRGGVDEVIPLPLIGAAIVNLSR